MFFSDLNFSFLKRKSIEIAHLRLALFLFSILLYGLFSYPFPKSVGLAEIFIGFFLLMSFSFEDFIRCALRPNKNSFLWLVFFIFLISPSIVFSFSGWSLTDYIRDIIPLFYFFAFVTHYHNFRDGRSVKLLLVFMLVASIGFVFRYWIGFYKYYSMSAGYDFYDDSYYAFEPLVVFGAVYFACVAIDKLSFTLYGFFVPALCLFFSVLSFSVILITTMRAGVVLGALSVFIFALANRPKLVFVLVFVLSVIALLGFDISIFDRLIEKTQEHGFNNKLEEAYAILSAMGDSYFNAVLGYGWGGLVYSPGYGEEFSNTHSLFTYLLVKTGFLGLLVFLFVFVFYVRRMFLFYIGFGKCAVASIPVFLIGLFFQPSYKTLGFGLVVLLCVATYKYEKSSLSKFV